MVSVYRASLAQARGDTAGVVAHARRALELADPSDHLTRGGAAGFLGLAAWAAGDLGTGLETFGEAARSLTAAGNVADALGMTVVLATMWLAQGRPAEARRLYERALETAGQHRGPPLSTHRDLHVGLADVLREHGRPRRGRGTTSRARGTSASGPPCWRTGTAGSRRWRALQRARGDLDAAADLLDKAEVAVPARLLPRRASVPAARARVRIAQGRLADAWDWADEHDGAETSRTYLDEFDQLTLARLQIAQHRADGSTAPLDADAPAARPASSPARRRPTVEAASSRPTSCAPSPRTRAATATAPLRRPRAALSLGVPAGYRRLFLDEGAPLVELSCAPTAAGPDRAAAAHATTLLSAVVPARVSGSRRDVSLRLASASSTCCGSWPPS